MKKNFELVPKPKNRDYNACNLFGMKIDLKALEQFLEDQNVVEYPDDYEFVKIQRKSND